MDIPHNLDLERAVLGALLVDAGAIDEVRDVLAERDFYRLAYQRTWSAVCALGARGESGAPCRRSVVTWRDRWRRPTGRPARPTS